MTHPPRNKNKIFMISLYLGLHSKTNLTHGIAVKINAQSSPLYLQRYTQYPDPLHGPEGRHNPTLNKDSLTPFT